MSPFVFIAFSTVFGICGQLSLKRGMSTDNGSSNLIKRMLTSPWVIGGLMVYGFGVIFWLMAMSRFELSYVYPFASLSYVGIIIGSYFIFKEKLSAMRLVGIAIIIIGVLITSQS